MHDHPVPDGWGATVPDLSAATAALAAVALYLVAVGRLRRRGDAWPRVRDACFTAGGALLAVAALGDLPGGEFTAHMARHLLAGMAAPLLLVLGRPVTLALRTVPPGTGRRALLGVLHSRPTTWLLFPPLTGLLDIGGLWLLYRTPLFAATHDRPWAHALVHLHVMIAGLLFTIAVCQLDPVRHRYSLALRAATLVTAGAAHAVLAKSLYGAAPPGTGFSAADLRTGAELMYYGGDLIEIALATVIALQWYAAGGRALARDRNRVVRATPDGRA